MHCVCTCVCVFPGHTNALKGKLCLSSYFLLGDLLVEHESSCAILARIQEHATCKHKGLNLGFEGEGFFISLADRCTAATTTVLQTTVVWMN